MRQVNTHKGFSKGLSSSSLLHICPYLCQKVRKLSQGVNTMLVHI